MIEEEELKAMKETVFLVNTVQGNIVDGNGSAQALSNGWIAGAATLTQKALKDIEEAVAHSINTRKILYENQQLDG